VADQGVYLRFEGSSGSSVPPRRIATGAKVYDRKINAVKFGRLDAPFTELVFLAADLAGFDRPQDR